MKSDAVVRIEAMDTLIKHLGEVDAERFITIVKSDAFNYTEWRRGLWENKSINEIHRAATEYEAVSS